MQLNPAVQSIAVSPISAAYAHLPHRSGDQDLLDLSQAAPAYPTAPVIAQRIAEVAGQPDGGKYAPLYGLPSLREAFAAELAHDYRAVVRPDRTMIVAGCNQAFCSVTSALASPGDEIIISSPFYFNHHMWLEAQRFVPRYLQLWSEDPVGEATELLSDRTRALVLVTPGNPTGAILDPATIDRFADLCERNNIALIIDETYRNFRGTDEPAHQAFSRAHWDRTVISLHSFSKDLAIPGYRVGAIVGGAAMLNEVGKIQDCVAISAPRVGQEATLTGLVDAGEWRKEQTDRIFQSLLSFRTMMADRPGGFELVQSGAFFGWVRHPFGDRSTDDVVRDLIVQHDVLTIPGSAFTPEDQGFLRFSFANLDPASFGDLAQRLARVS